MSKIAKVQYILNSYFLDNNRSFEEKAAGMQLDVDYSKCQSVQYQFDKNMPKAYKGGLFPFFADNPKVCSICDYIIFAELSGQIYAILVELKRGKSQSLPQLNAAECFANYINLTYNRIHNQNETFIVRKVTIREVQLKKKRTKMKEVTYDQFNHHFHELNKFYLIAYLK